MNYKVFHNGFNAFDNFRRPFRIDFRHYRFSKDTVDTAAAAGSYWRLSNPCNAIVGYRDLKPSSKSLARSLSSLPVSSAIGRSVALGSSSK